MDENYIRLSFNRPTTASSIPEDSEVNHASSRSNRGKQTSYESVIAFDLSPPTTQSVPEDGTGLQQPSSSRDLADADLRPMVDVYKGLTLADLTDPLPGRAPDYPMHVLMQVAIQSSPLGKLRQCEIRDALIERFPYFANAGKTWRNTLRHALTNRLSFYKVPKPPSVPGRGAYWSYRFTREPKRKSRPSSSRSNGGGKPGRLRGHSKRGSTFDEDEYEDDDDDDDDDADEALDGIVGAVPTMTDAPFTTPPLPELGNDTMSECFSRPSTSYGQPLSLDASVQSFREHRQSSAPSFTALQQHQPSTSNPTTKTGVFDIPQVLSPPQITTSHQSTSSNSVTAQQIPTAPPSSHGSQFAHQHRPTTTSSLDVPLGILSISSPNPHQNQLSANPATTPGFEQQQQQDFSSYLVPPPNSASSFTSVLSGQSSMNGYASTTTPGDDTSNSNAASAWLFPETNLFSSFSDDGMFAFSLPMDNTPDPSTNFYYNTAPPQSANSLNYPPPSAGNNTATNNGGGMNNYPVRCNWSSDSNLSTTVFSDHSVASPPQSRMGSSYGGAGVTVVGLGPSPLSSTHSRPVTSHEALSSTGALLSPGLDFRPTSAGSVYGVTLPRPATASFSSAGKDLWSASLAAGHPLQQQQHPTLQQQQQLQQQQAQIRAQQTTLQAQSHPNLEPIMHSPPNPTPDQGSLAMWNAMPAGFVGGGFDGLTGHPGIDAFAHARKWSV